MGSPVWLPTLLQFNLATSAAGQRLDQRAAASNISTEKQRLLWAALPRVIPLLASQPVGQLQLSFRLDKSNHRWQRLKGVGCMARSKWCVKVPVAPWPT
jgi:hypothetical protein